MMGSFAGLIIQHGPDRLLILTGFSCVVSTDSR